MNRTSHRTIIGLLCMTAILTLVTEAYAVICPSTKFKCDLDNNPNTPKVNCKYVACGGACCLAPGSIIADLAGRGFSPKDVGDIIEVNASPLPNPPVLGSTIPGLVVCANKPGNDPFGAVEGETTDVLGGFSGIAQVDDKGAITETAVANLDAAALAALDPFCSPGHVPVDFLPFEFTFVVSVVNPDGSIDQNDSKAAACVHPDPASVGVVTQGPNKGAVTGGPYECDECPFLDANSDGRADVAGCVSCVDANGTLNDTCPPFGQPN